MSDEFLGEIRLFAGNFAPRNFAFCTGQVMPVSTNTQLFSVIGTTYGGDGISVFCLPNLLGCFPMHPNEDELPGRSKRPLGKPAGDRKTQLNANQLPSHNHSVTALALASNKPGPDGNSFPGNAPGGRTQPGPPVYAAPNTAATPLHPDTILSAGAGEAFEMKQPYLALNYIICIRGQAPPRT